MNKLTEFAHGMVDVIETFSGLVKRPVPPVLPIGHAQIPQTVITPESRVALRPKEQWGLKLPDGNIVWEGTLYKGMSLASPQDRASVIAVLRKTAEDLNFDTETFLGFYGWAWRVGVPAMQWGETEVLPLTIGVDSQVKKGPEQVGPATSQEQVQ